MKKLIAGLLVLVASSNAMARPAESMLSEKRPISIAGGDMRPVYLFGDVNGAGKMVALSATTSGAGNNLLMVHIANTPSFTISSVSNIFPSLTVTGMQLTMPGGTEFDVPVGNSGGVTKFISPETKFLVITPGKASATTCSDSLLISLKSCSDAALNGWFTNSCGHPYVIDNLNHINGTSVYLVTGTAGVAKTGTMLSSTSPL